MRSSRAASLHLALLAAVLAAPARAGESSPRRAAEAGLSPQFCPTLRALLDAAGSGFAGLRGAARAGGEHMWEGTTRFPGGGECTVFGGTPPAYVCTLYAGDVEENADGVYDRAVSGLKDCPPAGGTPTETVDGMQSRTTRAVGDGGVAVRVVSRDVSGDAYLVELWVDGARH